MRVYAFIFVAFVGLTPAFAISVFYDRIERAMRDRCAPHVTESDCADAWRTQELAATAK